VQVSVGEGLVFVISLSIIVVRARSTRSRSHRSIRAVLLLVYQGARAVFEAVLVVDMVGNATASYHMRPYPQEPGRALGRV
jgi:hypothetical protein